MGPEYREQPSRTAVLSPDTFRALANSALQGSTDSEAISAIPCGLNVVEVHDLAVGVWPFTPAGEFHQRMSEGLYDPASAGAAFVKFRDLDVVDWVARRAVAREDSITARACAAYLPQAAPLFGRLRAWSLRRYITRHIQASKGQGGPSGNR